MSRKPLPLATFALFAFEQEAFIRAAVEAALAQDYEPLEIILSDDASSDRTHAIMQEIAAGYCGPHRVRVRRNARNLGIANHINAVLREAQGEFLCWAAADDVSMPHRVSTLLAPMIEDASIVGTHSSVVEIDLDGAPISTRSPLEARNLSLRRVIRSQVGVISQAHAFRRRAFDHFGPLNPDLTNEGPPMAFRELVLGRIVYVDQPTVYYRIGSGTSTQRATGDGAQRAEPIKVTGWRLSAARQMLADLARAPTDIRKCYAPMIASSLAFYADLMAVNTDRQAAGALCRNFLRRPGDARTLRAYLRRRCPPLLYQRLR